MKRAKIVHPFRKLFTNKIFLGESKWASRSSPMSILFRTSIYFDFVRWFMSENKLFQFEIPIILLVKLVIFSSWINLAKRPLSALDC